MQKTRRVNAVSTKLVNKSGIIRILFWLDARPTQTKGILSDVWRKSEIHPYQPSRLLHFESSIDPLLFLVVRVQAACPRERAFHLVLGS